MLDEQRSHFERYLAHVVPAHAWAGIEIDPQLVGMLQIGAAHRMRMQLHAAQVDDPSQAGRVVDDHFFGSATRWK